ncbi:MAG: hypothetical protein RJA44_2569 [Pseudomonadota bacterium]
MNQPSLALRLRRQLRAGCALLALLLASSLGHAQGSRPAASSTASAETLNDEAVQLRLPDIEVRDQQGQKRRFYTDLVKGRSVAVNFIFTSCTSICTPLTAGFKAMQTELARSKTPNVQLISISVDPLTDTPEQLRLHAQKFGAGPGWSFITGSRSAIDTLLKAFGVSAGDPNDHTPIAFLGHDPSGRWTRASGLANPELLAKRLISLGQPTTSSSAADSTPELPAQMRQMAEQQVRGAQVQQAASGSKGADYFTNLPLQAHDRGRVRFYNDLIRDQVVLISTFYTSCKDVCSPVTYNLAQTQQLLEESLPGRVRLLSISTDPVADTEEVLREFARRHGARPGWSFVTGKKENIDWVLHKFGLYGEDKAQHNVALWVGNDRTGTWLKLHAMASPASIVAAVRKVL